MAKSVNNKKKNNSADEATRLKNKQAENRELKKEIGRLQSQIDGLKESFELISVSHQASVELLVDFLYDMEYFKYKSSFVDIDINLRPGSEETLKNYGKNIKNFFMKELRCTYLFIKCSGIFEERKDIIKVTAKQRLKDTTEYDTTRSLVSYVDLVDLDLPERKIGRIIIGRFPYRDARKESRFNQKMEEEILLTKRLLENSVSARQNKELAVKDALTGLNTRKIMEERLNEEFKSLDFFGKLPSIETQLLQIIMKADGQPAKIIRNMFFKELDTNDEGLFNRSLESLQADGIISVFKDKYLGEFEDFLFFENSKLKYNLYIAMFDLDHFKDVNDNWGGHAVGDRVLKSFSEILKKYIRTTDMPIRYGGEEFMIIFPRVGSSTKIIETLERIRLECEEKLIIKKNGKMRNVTVSIGLTQLSKYDRNIEQIIKRADAALYRAKKRRNRVVFYDQEKNGYTRVL